MADVLSENSKMISLAVSIDRSLEKLKTNILEPSKLFYASEAQKDQMKNTARDALEEIKNLCLTHKNDAVEFHNHVVDDLQKRQQRIKELTAKLNKDAKVLDALEQRYCEKSDYIKFKIKLVEEVNSQVEAVSIEPDEDSKSPNENYQSLQLDENSKSQQGEGIRKSLQPEENRKAPLAEENCQNGNTNVDSEVRFQVPDVDKTVLKIPVSNKNRVPSPEWARNPSVLLTPSLFKPHK